MNCLFFCIKCNSRCNEFCNNCICLIIFEYYRIRSFDIYRWSLIAGRLPGRTANDVKNYWNTHRKKLAERSRSPQSEDLTTIVPSTPEPQTTTAAVPPSLPSQDKNIASPSNENIQSTETNNNVATSSTLIDDIGVSKPVPEMPLVDGANEQRWSKLLGDNAVNLELGYW